MTPPEWHTPESADERHPTLGHLKSLVPEGVEAVNAVELGQLSVTTMELFWTILQQFTAQHLFPVIEASAIVVCNYDGQVDAKVSIELGAALYLDKPVILIVKPDVTIPAKLLMAVDRVVIGDLQDEETKAEFQRVLSELRDQHNLNTGEDA